MQKGSSSYTSHVWNASITCSRFFISRKRKFILFGGVLLCCLFALIPNRSYALQTLIAPSSNTGFSQFENVVGRGCLSREYSFVNGGTFTGGLMYDHSIYPCGWHRTNGTNVVQSDQSSAHSKIWKNYNGSSIYQDRNNFSGSNWDYSGINGGNIRSMLTGVNLRALRQNSDAWLYFDPQTTGGDTGNVIALYGFNYDSDINPTGIPPRIDTSYYHIYIKDYTNQNIDITDNPIYGENAEDQTTYLEYVVNEINNSIVMSCSNGTTNGLNLFNSHFPSEILNEFSSGYENYSCFIAFSIPLSNSYVVKFDGGNIAFSWPPSNMLWEFNDNGNISFIPNIGFSSGINSLNYSDSGLGDYSTLLEFNISNPKLVFLTPDTTDDVDYLRSSLIWLKDYNSSFREPDYSLNQNGNGSGAYMGWFDVFRISFIFPFSSLFNSFTNSSCVNIPIIASMVGSSNTQYCTWWPSSIRDILTPVFTMISLMVVTGFVIHWLSDRQTSIGGSS